jgi:hypothetical protein
MLCYALLLPDRLKETRDVCALSALSITMLCCVMLCHAVLLLDRLKETRDACALSALSINMRKKSQPLIWGVPGLPSDACGLMAVPRGGVLVLSQNLLMYYAQVGWVVVEGGWE